MIKSLFRAFVRALAELVESESGEFLTTREKSRRLHAMLHEHEQLDGPPSKVNSGRHELLSSSLSAACLRRHAHLSSSPAR